VPGQPGNYTAITTASSGYDGLGHYRIAAASDNIGAGTSRTERTDWNPNSSGLLALSAPPGPASDGAINVLGKGLEHVVARHTVVGMLTTGKSVFRAEENIVKLIKAASAVNPTLQPNGNLRFVMNAGRAIGYDVKAGGPTSFYTVITDRARNLITAFPGL
jgi:hypothetical protein